LARWSAFNSRATLSGGGKGDFYEPTKKISPPWLKKIAGQKCPAFKRNIAMPAIKQLAADEALASPKATTALGKNPVVLLVDDDTQLQRVFSLLARRLNVQVDAAISAEEGLIKAREISPALIVTDINLPGLNGVQLIERLKGDPLTRPIPIVAWSGNAEYRASALAAGAVDFINKSDPAGRMIQCLQKLPMRAV
jgi:CheY-like chemotaxis protein